MTRAAPRYIRVAKWAFLACSLLVGVAWSVSYFRSVVLQAPYVSALLSHGRIGVGTSRLPGVPVRDSIRFRWSGAIEPAGPPARSFDSFVTLDGWNMLVIPLWLPFGLTFVPAMILFIRYRRRRTPGHCARCGYDLTGNVTGRCPECGVETPV